MKEIKTSLIVRYALVTFFLLPFLFFVYKFRFQVELDWRETWWALKNSIYQSTLASFFVLLLAVPMSFGISSLNDRWRSVVSHLLLLPQILPVFFTVLILFSVIRPFPMGSAGIIILFVAVNLGLAAVLIHQVSVQKLSTLAATAEVYSVPRLRFLKKVYFPVLYADLLQIFFLIFVFCMSSFSIPLLAGDGRAVNLEILVFEKVFIDGNWAAGFGVSLVQSFFVFGLSSLMLNGETLSENAGDLRPSYLKARWALMLTAVYTGVYLAGYAFGVIQSLFYTSFLFQYSSDILHALVFSLKALLLFAVVTGLILYAWLWDYIKNKRFSPVLHFVSLSTVVAGFAVYLFFPTSSKYDLLKLILAAAILFFTPLFKLFLQSPVESLSRQLQVAEVFGVKNSSVIIDVVLRQLKPAFALWFSVLSIWFASDYAISKAVGLQTQTLGLLAQGFLSSYRMPAAFLMSLIIILTILLFLFVLNLIMKAAYVGYKKLTL
jgi:ABC-type Fe3+ transport system permease subunit